MELLWRRDPQGYYVIPAKRDALKVLKISKDIIVEEAGTLVFIKTRSRRLAKRIVLRLEKLGLLETQP
ncbi:MAG: hypothetical protein DRJ36_02575 [Thermoprotei archaeon]|nr:MAG: hypothetical protein DRJ36_02575 [Thermoprotei archaeon]